MRWTGHVARMGEREREEVHIEFRWENLIKDHLENPGVDGDNIKMYFREVEWGAWTGSIWFRMGTGGELL